MRSLTDTMTGTILRRSVLLCAMALALAGCQPPPAPPPEPPPEAEAAPPSTPTPDRIVEARVYFNFDSHIIHTTSYDYLDTLATALTDRRLNGYHFYINGYTDARGRLTYNIALSELRAMTVADYLVSRGVPRESLTPQGFGPADPLVPWNPFSAGNRRVEIVSVR